MYRIFFLFSKFCTKCLHWVQMTRCWQWGPADMSSVMRGQGCPMMDTAGSRWLQWTHHRAQLNPSAKMVMPLRKCMSDRVKNTIQQWEKWGKNAREMSLQTLRWDKKVGEEVLWALEQIPVQAVEEPIPEQVAISWRKLQDVESPHCSRFILKDCSACEGPMLKQRRSVRRKKSQR